jgi:ABC-2 type transport system permease protein
VTALVHAELLKARTTRTAFGLALGLLGIVALFAILVPFVIDANDTTKPTQDTLGTIGFAALFALLFGILSVTGEWRHGTISETFLVTPRRARVVVGKMIAGAVVGLVLALAAAVLGTGLAAVTLPANGFDFDVGEAAPFLGEVLLASSLWGALGAGLGAVLPNQVGAIIGALASLFVVEPIVQGLWPHVGQWLPGQAATQGIVATGGGVRLSVAVATVVTLAYVAAAGVVGAALVARRDVT